jgi:S-adenosylmethionine:tRNA ribosyltransferase-isomerase
LRPNCKTLKPFADISPDQFKYELPEERIAVFPAEIRDKSRLLIREEDGTLHEDTFRNISDYLVKDSHLFFNNSKVIPARIIFTKESGSRVEIFCLKPSEPSNYTASLLAKRTCSWECMIGNLKRFSRDSLHLKISSKPVDLMLRAEKTGQSGNMVIVKFTWDNDKTSFGEILTLVGQTPLPPYIKRDPVETDRERYQTIYSKYEGSVAAPTAGLHFTELVFEKLAGKHISRHEITLHVGAGTFQPIKTNRVKDHEMHAEFFIITPGLIRLLAGMSDRVACVGTTTVRTLESIYWLGIKVMVSEIISPRNLHIDQWEPYNLPVNYSMRQSFEALGEWMEKFKLKEVVASTKLMIIPGYRFNVVNTLVTNFHQPGSTLLLLIAAFIGETWKETYNYALQHDFKFLSYGDSSLLFNPGQVEPD